jgi:putative DNA primase/helicase
LAVHNIKEDPGAGNTGAQKEDCPTQRDLHTENTTESKPAPDKAEAARYLKPVDSEATFFTFQTFNDNKEGKKALDEVNKQRKREGKSKLPDPFARIIHGTLDKWWAELVRLNDQGAGIFVTVNATDGTGRTAADIVRVRVLFVDLDGAPLEPVMQWRTPHIAVESSPGKFHAYWIVTGVALEEFEGLQKALAARFDGDRVHDLSRVMRLPGFIHRKSEPFLTRIIQANEHAPYKAADFADILPDAEGPSGTGDGEISPLRKLNTAALTNLSAWVPEIFPDAKPTAAGGYRVTSAMLGRDLEEDLSISPQGIVDFGVHDMGDEREGKRTPIDIVTEYGEKDHQEAVAWLRARLGLRQESEKPIIQIKGGQIAQAIDQAEVALIAAGVPILVRTGMLVHPIVDNLPTTDGGKTEVTLLKPLCKENLVYALNKHAAIFLGYNERKKRSVEINPPPDVAMGLLRKGQWQFPKVAGVITTPTLRPDGTILDQPGYDPATQLWYAPDSYMVIPALKTEPTREEAEQAFKLYEDLLENFPFITDVDRSVALAAILTPLLRGAFDVAPMILIVAYDVGSGKGYFFDLVSTIARGRPCPVITNIESIEEMEKRLGALVLAGVPMISLDNCSVNIGGDLLCQITERRVINIRILGKSEAPECEWRGTMFGTGNNITFVGDMTRRGLSAALDPKVERAELRTFDFDPIARVLANRGAYVAAAITIARAYIAAGKRVECAPLGSYGQWSQVVREPLIWLNKTDPVKSMDDVREADPVRNAVRELIAIWKEKLTIRVGYTAVELHDSAYQTDDHGELIRPELCDLLLLQAGTARGDIDTRKLGNWLAAIKGQIHHGHRIELVKESERGNRYALVPMKGDGF